MEVDFKAKKFNSDHEEYMSQKEFQKIQDNQKVELDLFHPCEDEISEDWVKKNLSKSQTLLSCACCFSHLTYDCRKDGKIYLSNSVKGARINENKIDDDMNF